MPSFKMNSLLLLICLVLIPQAVVIGKKGRGSKWWGIANTGDPNYLNDNYITRRGRVSNYLDLVVHTTLTKRQRKLVRINPGTAKAVVKGARMAMSECQHQFQNRKWNCTTTDHLRGRLVFGKIVDKGCRETAFIYAITSAGVTHAVSRACSEGLVDSCTCDYRNRGPSGTDWEWGGCSDNIEFGYKFTKDFVDSAERGRDLRYLMNLHNNEAGRLHISSEMRRECKCHGMSGSCTVKTCWMRLPSFREVGNHLKGCFDGASKVLVSNSNFRGPRNNKNNNRLRPYDPNHKPPTEKDLVYFETSPDFCERDPKLGIKGTKGRQCNDTSLGVEGCDLMCCGRGFKTEVREVLERCKCTFQWCCKVKCKVCKTKKTVHTCL